MMILKKLFMGIFVFLVVSCSPSPEIQIAQLDEPETPTPKPTATNVPKPTPTPLINFLPENFSFPVSFDGPYSIEGNLRYVPCFHWDGVSKKLIEEVKVWKYLFHAGDMFILNLEKPVQDIVFLSPTDGVIERVTQINEENIEIIIRTPYYFNEKQVYVDINHSQKLFEGDDIFPPIRQGDFVAIGQPIAHQNLFMKHGREEQVLDIAIRNGPRGANPSIKGNFFPESYIDPFLYLEDDFLNSNKNMSYDSIGYRDHCKESIHFPYEFLD